MDPSALEMLVYVGDLKQRYYSMVPIDVK